jgi:hypothetical protein
MATSLRNTRNPLLAKDDVGKARVSSYDLPEDGFAYGRPDNPDFEGAREVTMQWVSHTPRPRMAESIQDFRKLNKIAITDKATTARAVYKHRKANDLPLSARSSKPLPDKVIPSDVVPGFTYGKQTRPSTPIASVVSYQFSSEFEEDISKQYGFLRLQKEEDAKIRKIPITRASRGHASALKKAGAVTLQPKEHFKISKFKRVPCKVEFPGGKTSELRRLADKATLEMPEEIQEGIEAHEAAKSAAPATEAEAPAEA